MGRPSAMSIDKFLGKFKTGARSYLFYMTPQFPPGIKPASLEDGGVYMVRSTSLPSSNFDEIIASWQGFDFKTPGKRLYDTWNVSFTVDMNADIRKAFLKWQDLILDPEKNTHSLPSVYMQNQTVSLLGIGLTEILTYELVYAFPQSVAEISLDYQDSNFATFDVTFQYQYFKTTPK